MIYWFGLVGSLGESDRRRAKFNRYPLMLAGIWPTAPRDAVLLSYVQRLSDGRFLNVNRSIESELMLPKDSDGLVRMDAKIAGQIVGPSASGKPK